MINNEVHHYVSNIYITGSITGSLAESLRPAKKKGKKKKKRRNANGEVMIEENDLLNDHQVPVLNLPPEFEEPVPIADVRRDSQITSDNNTNLKFQDTYTSPLLQTTIGLPGSPLKP